MPQRNIVACVTLAWLCALSWNSLEAIAQFPRPASEPTMEWAPLPSHRYLPPPQGARNVLDQVKLLERLNQMVGQNGEEAPLQLSPAQMKLLNDVVESFRNDKGEIELPDPQSIPEQWINNLLPDPKQREQAKRMLEKYARDNQLPLKSDSNGLPMPKDMQSSGSQPTAPDERDGATRPGDDRAGTPQSGSERSNKDQSKNVRPGEEPNSQNQRSPGNSQRRQAEATGNQSQADEPSSDSSLPGGIPKEYRQLFDKLKQFEKQNRQALEADAPWQSNGSNPNQPSTRNPAGADSKSSRSADSQQPSNQRPNGNNSGNRNGGSKSKARQNPTAPQQNNSASPSPNRYPPNNNLNNPQSGSPNNNSGARPSNSPGTNPLDGPNPNYSPNGDASGRSERVEKKNPPLGESGKVEQPTDAPNGNNRSSTENPSSLELDPSQNPFSNEFRAPQNPKPADNQALTPAMDATSLEDTAGNSKTPAQPRTSRGFNVTQLSEQPKPGSSNRNMDVRRSIEQSGLAKSLKKIVDNAIKEQETERKRLARSQASGKQPGASKEPAIPESLEEMLRSSQASNNKQNQQPATTGNGGSANATGGTATGINAQGSGTPSNWSDARSESSERWARWMNDLWKSVSVANDSPRQSASPSSASGGTASLGMPEFRWTGSMTAVVLIVATLIAVLYWLGRRRLVEATVGSQQQAEWIKSVLSEGLKTRADVVRAFHRLVGRASGVAQWWNHRSVVRHFNEHTPQYAAAISELATVYEQARYFPDDAQLSPQQLEQVRRIVQSMSQAAK